MEWPVANTKTEEKNDQKTLNGPKNENAYKFILLLSQGSTIPKIRIPGQKMWAGRYRLK